MAESSTIEWTDATWQPITGCAIVSPGCTNCYAMKLAGTRLRNLPARTGHTGQTKAGPVWNGKVRLNEEWLTQPLTWRRPRKIFVCAHGDLFAESVPDEWIDRVFAVMALCPQHTFQVLTKRADRMRAYLSGCRERLWQATLATGDKHCSAPFVVPFYSHAGMATADKPESWPLPNVWLGVSAEDQRRADERVPDLLATPAAVRFVSAEPLLGQIDLRSFMWPVHGWWKGPHRSYAEAKAAGAECGLKRQALVGAWCTFLDWVIVGGESGPGARPMHPDWARQIRDACAAAGVAYLFKQWGAFQHGSTMGRAPSLDRIVFNDGRILTDVTKPACKAEDREHGWQGRAPEMMALVGKKVAGRLLDGVEHNGFPEVAR